MSTPQFFRNTPPFFFALSLSWFPQDPLLSPFLPNSPPNLAVPSPLLLTQLPDQSFLCMCAAPHCSAYPILTSSSWWTLQSSFVYLTHLSSGTHNNCVHCLFVSPLFRTKRGEKEGGGGGDEKTKMEATIKFSLLPMNPVRAVSQLYILWTNLEACKVAHYSSRVGVFQERIASMADEHREGFVSSVWLTTLCTG